MGGQGDGRALRRPAVLRIPPRQGLQRSRARGQGACASRFEPQGRPVPVPARRRRRDGRPDDGRQERRRKLDPAHHTAGACRGRAPGARHAAPVGRRGHRPDQGEHPVPTGIRHILRHRFASHPRFGGRRDADRPGRRPVPAYGLDETHPRAGIVGERVRDPQGRRVRAHTAQAALPRGHRADGAGGREEGRRAG